MKPWELATSGSPNINVQADCYRAVFETFWNKPWFSGIYWWTWNTSAGAGGPANRGFTPQNKLALTYLNTWYGKVEPRYVSEVEFEERIKVMDAVATGRYAGEKGKVAFTGAMAGLCVQDLGGTRAVADFDYFEYRTGQP